MDKKANIQIKDDGVTFRVLGPYMEMKDVYPKLKTKGFRYDGNDKAWWINKSKFKGTLSDIETIVNGLTENLKVKEQEEKKSNTDLIQEIYDFGKELNHIKVVIEYGSGNLSITGLPYDLFGDKAYSLGGKWKQGWFDFARPQEKLKDILKKYDDEIENRIKEIKPYVGQSFGVSPYVISLETKDSFLFVHSSSSELRDYIKKAFPTALWKDAVWKTFVMNVGDIDNSVKIIKDGCDSLGAKELDKKLKEQERKTDGYFTMRYNTAWSGSDIYDYQIGEIVKNKWNKTPEWLKITSVKKAGHYEGSDYFFVVQYEPLTPKELADWTNELHSRKTISEAKKRVNEIADEIRSKGIAPSKLIPSGDMWIEDKSERLSVYGGGHWFYIDTNDVVYIRNNGGDGDSWANNNVSTGGAGAIGWKLNDKEFASELEILLPIAGYKKK